MQLAMFRSLWTGPQNIDALMQQTLAADFDGIEGPIPRTREHRQQLKHALQSNNLLFIAESTTGGDFDSSEDWWIARPYKTIADHIEDLKWTLEYAEEMGALFVSSMCGYDAWTWEQNIEFFGQALELEESSGISIGFETHRGRSLFNPWMTRDLLHHFPQMKLTCDFSHWVVVCERLLDSEWHILELCAERALHVQCRVGYPQHAQVSDPRAPEYQKILDAHDRWWELVWRSQANRGMARTTMTPEFLWDGYMQTLPYTQQPVADVWEITCWMAMREKRRFSGLYPEL